MPFKSLKLWGLLTILLTVLLMISAEAGAQNAESSKQPAPKEKEEQPPPGLAELVHMASKLDERYNSLERKIETIFDLKAAKKRYDANTEKFEKLTERVQAKIAEENPSYQDLAELKSAIRERDKTNKDQISKIRNAISKVENWRAEWLDEYQKWTLWENSLLKKVSISSVELTFKKAKKIISDALDLIQMSLEPLLLGQQKVEDFRYRIYKLNAEVDKSILILRGGVLRKKTPIMFSSRFFLNLRRAMYLELPRQFRLSLPDKEFFAEEAWVIILQIFIALAVAVGVRQNREKLQEMPK